MESTVSVHGFLAVRLLAAIASLATAKTAETGVCLGANTDAIPDFDVSGGFSSDVDGDADDFVTDADRVGSRVLSVYMVYQ